MAENIRADTTAMGDVRAQMEAVYRELREDVTQTSQRAEQLTRTAFKADLTSSAFARRVRTWNGAVSTLYDTLDKLQQALRTTADEFGQTDQQHAQQAENIQGGGAR